MSLDAVERVGGYLAGGVREIDRVNVAGLYHCFEAIGWLLVEYDAFVRQELLKASIENVGSECCPRSHRVSSRELGEFFLCGLCQVDRDAHTSARRTKRSSMGDVIRWSLMAKVLCSHCHVWNVDPGGPLPLAGYACGNCGWVGTLQRPPMIQGPGFVTGPTGPSGPPPANQSTGSAVATGMVGAALGAAVGGPAGAVIGGLFGALIGSGSKPTGGSQ